MDRSTLAPAPASEPHNPSFPWSEDRARGVARTVAKRKLPMFSAWPDIELDDLFAECFMAISRAHPKFNPDYRTPSGKRICYSTFAYSVASRQLIDIWRSRARRTNGEIAFRESLPCNPHVLRPERLEDELREMPLVDWVAQVYLRALRAHRVKGVRRGRKWYGLPQCVAAALLMRRLKLSCRGAAMLLAEREDLRQALRMSRCPSYVWCHRARRIAKQRARSRWNLKPPQAEPPAVETCAA